MALLTQAEYLATFGQSRLQIGEDQAPPFNFWPYFDQIPQPDFEGYDCSAGVIANGYRISPGGFEHILVNSENRNVFMVLVLDRDARVVLGHRLLNLNQEYGLHI